MPLKASLLVMPPEGVRLPVPPDTPPPTAPDDPKPLPAELLVALDEPPSPLEGVVSGIEPSAVVPLDALAPEALEPLVLEVLEVVDVPPVVVLLRPPVVAVCASTPSESPKKTALIILFIPQVRSCVPPRD
jgi:hypothetical protein